MRNGTARLTRPSAASETGRLMGNLKIKETAICQKDVTLKLI